MGATKEQQDVIDTAVKLFKSPEDELLKVTAIAGAGKTHTLIELTKAIEPKTAMYLAYNKAIQLEAAEKFKGTRVVCKTMHALAYGKTVKKYGLNVKFFTTRDITERLTYENKREIVSLLESFLLSGELDINVFLKDKAKPAAAKLILKYYDLMMQGKVGGGHSFYLKLYHILLANGTIQPPNVDLLMVDEFGDITALTIEIFKLINARLKVAVGDSSQNIYSFAHSIDGFKVLKKDGTLKALTQSFRVADNIAERIQEFCTSTFDSTVVFKGRKMKGNEPDTSHAYIARSNSGVIKKMLELHKKGIPYNLTRNPKDIFGLVLTIASLKAGGTIYDDRYKWLGKIATKHASLVKSGKTTKSLRSYLNAEAGGEPGINGAIALITKYGLTALFALFEEADKHKNDKKTHYATITTAHSCKGLEFTTVSILDDLNKSASDAIEQLSMLTPGVHDKEINSLNEELRLYYVACSRCMLHLHDAEYC